jgi:uncharacterized protein (TIGR02118 family)
MVHIAILYPNQPGKKFDMDYYLSKHMPFVRQKLDPLGLLKVEVDKGVATMQPGAPAPFVAIGHMYFNSMGDFQKAFGAHAEELMADVPNYTDIGMQVQISEVVG